MWCYESDIFFIGLVHINLIVSEKGVQEGEHSVFDGEVHHLVYSGQGKIVFWADII